MIVQEPGLTPKLDSFHSAEGKLLAIRRLLLDPRPEVLDQCRLELEEITGLLEELVAGGFREPNPAVLSSARQVKQAAQQLKLQIQHASMFCLGWIQLTSGSGYTERGLPVLMTGESRSSFEG